MKIIGKAFKVVGYMLLGTFLVIQLVPYGHDHKNPPVVQEPAWDQARTRELAVRACFDCHSNETHWPLYTHIAPISWLAQDDVEAGRRELNFSEWNRPQKEAGHCAESLLEHEMPPIAYWTVHQHARLSDEEERALVDGLRATLGPELERPVSER